MNDHRRAVRCGRDGTGLADRLLAVADSMSRSTADFNLITCVAADGVCLLRWQSTPIIIAFVITQLISLFADAQAWRLARGREEEGGGALYRSS